MKKEIVLSIIDHLVDIDCVNDGKWEKKENIDFPKCGHELNDISSTSIMRVNNDKRYFRYLRLPRSALENPPKS